MYWPVFWHQNASAPGICRANALHDPQEFLLLMLSMLTLFSAL
jgi:hypothetical protein